METGGRCNEIRLRLNLVRTQKWMQLFLIQILKALYEMILQAQELLDDILERLKVVKQKPTDEFTATINVNGGGLGVRLFRDAPVIIQTGLLRFFKYISILLWDNRFVSEHWPIHEGGRAFNIGNYKKVPIFFFTNVCIVKEGL